MIVEMTSLTPRVIFKIAGIRLHAAPASMAKISPTMRCRPGGRVKYPTVTAASAPMYTCPSAPMLNIPARTPMENVRAVRTRGTPRAIELAIPYESPYAPRNRAQYAFHGLYPQMYIRIAPTIRPRIPARTDSSAGFSPVRVRVISLRFGSFTLPPSPFRPSAFQLSPDRARPAPPPS